MIEIYFDEMRFPEEAAALRLLRLPPNAAAIGLDLDTPADGLSAIIAARRRGTTVVLLPILVDPFEAMLSTIFRSIFANRDDEQRILQLVALGSNTLQVNGKKPSELASYSKAQGDSAALALRLADVVLLQSPGDRERWQRLIGRPLRRSALLPVSIVGGKSSADEPGVTLYAPATPRESLLPIEAYLRRRRQDVVLIAAENRNDSISTRIVVAPEWRASRARSLAARGHVVVTPNITRVDECDPRIVGYTAADLQTLEAALDAAHAVPLFTDDPIAHRTSAPAVLEAQSALRYDGPPVSIIIRTYDRPELLRRAIASVAAQSYRDVEIIVVNNGGEDVAAVIESAVGGRPYRYEVMPERKLISAASNVGARAASGVYVGYLDDDDLLYGDHCSRTVEVLERSGADVVYTNCLAEYAKMHGDVKELIGYQLYLDRNFDIDQLYCYNVSPIHSIVHKRDIFDRFGYFDEQLPVTDDWELWLRVANGGGRFIRIDRVTCEYSWRYDPERGNMTVNHQWDFVNAYRSITERYAAYAAIRPNIRANQAATLSVQEQRAKIADDPARRAEVVISSMSTEVVAVTPTPELLQGF